MSAKEFIRQAPFIRLVIPLIAGIALRLQSPISCTFVLSLFILTFLVAFCFTIAGKLSINFKLRWIYGLFITLSIFLLGILITEYRLGQTKNLLKQTAGAIEIIGTISEPPDEKAKSLQCIVNLNAIKEKERFISDENKVILYVRKDSCALALKAGDVVVCKVRLNNIKSTGNPYEFDYKKYMSFQGVYFTGFVDANSWKLLASGDIFFLKKWAYFLRDKLLAIFPNLGMKGDELGVASALIVGDKSNLDTEIKRAYVASGTMHILAVSGMHVAILYWVLNMGLFFMNNIKNGRFLKLLIVLVAVWIYAMITGLSGSVLRAAAMITFVIVGESLNRKANIFNSLAASAFVLLVINPFNLMDVGFQLSYAAVISIVAFYPLIYERIEISNWLGNQIWILIAVTIAAQIVTTPISLYYFHQFPNLFLVSNLLMIPLSTGIMYMAIAIIPFSGWSWAMTWLGKVFNFLVWLLNKVVLTIEGLPFSLTKGIYINWLDVCLLYGFIISITLFLIRKRGFYLILSLVSVLFFFSNRLFINYQNITTKEMLVYGDKDNLIVQFRDGGSSTWLTSNKCAHLDRFIQVAADAGQCKFNKVLIIDTLQKQSRFEGMMLNRNLWMKGNFIQFYDKRIAISDLSEIQVSKKSTISVDYLLIKDVKIAKKQSLNEMYSVKCLILPSSISNYKARKVEKIMEKGRAKLHRIADSGAFILKF